MERRMAWLVSGWGGEGVSDVGDGGGAPVR